MVMLRLLDLGAIIINIITDLEPILRFLEIIDEDVRKNRCRCKEKLVQVEVL